jgi:Uma2 family endonuclease
MGQIAYNPHSVPDSPGFYDPARLDELPPVRPRRALEVARGPFVYGWRDVYETSPDGVEKLRSIPLTYEDTLNPQLGDHVSDSTNHTKLIRLVSDVLGRLYETKLSVAVWVNLKVRNPSGTAEAGKKDAPEGSKGPSPDVCVISGVKDRERNRESFELRAEPGEIRLAVEVVSKSSLEKDYGGILARYDELKVQEYVAIRPRGLYVEGPVELRAWRRDPESEKLKEVQLDKAGRFHSETTDLLFGRGPKGEGLEIRDAATGELLLGDAETRKAAEERAEKEAEARQQEAEKRQAAEKRVEQSLRQSARDLCAVLELAWDAVKSAQVKRMDASQLETLRRHLVREKSWPDSFPDVP